MPVAQVVESSQSTFLRLLFDDQKEDVKARKASLGPAVAVLV